MRPQLVIALTLIGFACNDPDGSVGDASPPIADAGNDADPGADGSLIDAGTPDAEPSPFTTHVIFPSCAPGGGPALTVLLSNASPSSGTECPGDDGGAMIEITVYTRDIVPPQTIEFGNAAAAGRAARCPGGGAPCVLASSGAITFTTFETGVGATGTYALEFGEERETGSFDADWCAGPVVCGPSPNAP